MAPAAADPVRRLLEGLDGIELTGIGRADECCGFGGSFSVEEEAVSRLMGRDRVEDHRRSGAEVVTSTDVSCLLHLEGVARREGAPLRVLHVAEILCEAAGARP
jgi:L-lactate dehydrogenase complex protein LldE